MRRVVISFLFCFAAAAAAAYADAATPPAPKFVVFFQEWSAKLDDAAQTVIGHAADQAKAQPGILHIEGFADPIGSRKANALLTDLRSQVVMDQLQADGVPVSRLRGRGQGSVHFALSSQESRRVEISIGGR